ncbi:class II glutamine amidotransferase [Nocardioides immobilis]|uniref:class II glutamine amidotransferase n=1 Tax=Nocardioides immobilis TaxID=2049295 RepID=UPI0015F8D461|nr:class II glutamine amidotransferase [Nocardioides immobilis]
MCRLLGFVGRRPTSVVEVLGQEDFDAFTALTALHGDGWGMAWLDPDSGTIRSTISAESAIHDPTYSRLAREPLGRAGIVHLRWASPGLPVTPDNTHPFVEGGYAFAHNGHIAPVERLEGLLTRDARGALRGDTDSERYFRFVLQCIAETGDDTDGLQQALGVLTSEFPEASLNSLLMTPTHMYGVHINSHAPAPVKGIRELFTSEDEIPYRHTDEYFAMDYRLTTDTAHIISSGIDAEGWTPVPEDTAAMVDLATLEATRLDGWAAERGRTRP